MRIRGCDREIEQLAVEMAIKGQMVRLVTPQGELVLEPGTGNIESVSLYEDSRFKVVNPT